MCDGNLSTISSQDHGATWGEPFQINDVNGTVDEGYNNFDIGNFHQIMWTDNRNGNKDLFYHLDYIPTIDLEVVNFTITKEELQMFIPTKNLLEIEIINNGDTTANLIPINIAYTCDDGNTTETQYTCYITDLSAGQTTIIKCSLFRFKMQQMQ